MRESTIISRLFRKITNLRSSIPKDETSYEHEVDIRSIAIKFYCNHLFDGETELQKHARELKEKLNRTDYIAVIKYISRFNEYHGPLMARTMLPFGRD